MCDLARLAARDAGLKAPTGRTGGVPEGTSSIGCRPRHSSDSDSGAPRAAAKRMDGRCPDRRSWRGNRGYLRGRSRDRRARPRDSGRRDRHPRSGECPQPRLSARAGGSNRTSLGRWPRFVLDLARAHVRTHRQARCRHARGHRATGVRTNAGERLHVGRRVPLPVPGPPGRPATATSCSRRSAGRRAKAAFG